MTHLFIPYELAIIAKEKGFNEPCFAFINLSLYKLPEQIDRVKLEYSVLGKFEYYNDNSHLLSSPLYQQIVDWFREKHKIFIQVDPFNAQFSGRDLGFVIYDFTLILPKTMKLTDKTRYEFRNYYEALNKAIEEAFKLI